MVDGLPYAQGPSEVQFSGPQKRKKKSGKEDGMPHANTAPIHEMNAFVSVDI